MFLRVLCLLSNDFKGVALRKIQFNEEILTDRSTDPLHSAKINDLKSDWLNYLRTGPWEAVSFMAFLGKNS